MDPTRLFGVVGRLVACVGGLVALVGEVVAGVGGPLALVGAVLGPVQRRGASGQPGLGGHQGLLGLPGPPLSRPDRASSTAKAATRSRWAAWTTSRARSASLREDDLAWLRSCWNAASGLTPRVATSTPLACSIQTDWSTPAATGPPQPHGWPTPPRC